MLETLAAGFVRTYGPFALVEFMHAVRVNALDVSALTKQELAVVAQFIVGMI